MYSKLAILAVLGVTVACTPHYKKGEIAYGWVGCHEVGPENPKDGETAFFILRSNKLKEGQKLYFKQVHPETLTVNKVKTATPCK